MSACALGGLLRTRRLSDLIQYLLLHVVSVLLNDLPIIRIEWLYAHPNCLWHIWKGLHSNSDALGYAQGACKGGGDVKVLAPG